MEIESLKKIFLLKISEADSLEQLWTIFDVGKEIIKEINENE
jgi:hypothetical protein